MFHKKVRLLSNSSFCILLVMLLAAAGWAWTPPDSLVGHWSQVFDAATVSIKQPKGSIHPDGAVQVNIWIHADGRVTGQVGAAELVQCRIKKNRSWLGRSLNFKTDFIIRGGYLQGGVISGDAVKKREFTIPFNIVNDNMRGSIMILQRWKYPHPLLPHLELQKKASFQL